MRQEPGHHAPDPDPDHPRLQIAEGGVAWLVFDDPERRHNVLTEAVMQRLARRLDEVRQLVAAGQVHAVVLWSAKPDSFIVGADVDAIAELEDPVEAERKVRQGQAIFLDLERLPVPTVAAIEGTCLGGGTEMALACRFRVASDAGATKIGLPEVQLGILPAWGGTTRLPRLVGLRNALDLLLTGKTVSASKARRIGLVSEVLPQYGFREQVADFARRTPEMAPGTSRKKRPFWGRLLEDTAPGRRLIIATARKRVESRTGGHYPAPLRMLDVLRDHGGSAVEESLDAEARAAGELVTGSVAKNLIHVFQLRERAKKDARVPSGTEALDVEELGVLGAGVMGGGIAQIAAYNDVRVRMKDIADDAVGQGLRHARATFDEAVEKRKLRAPEADRKMELVTGSTAWHGFGKLDLVVEAVVERMAVKHQVLRETEERVPEHCVLATNTSSLSIDEMADVLDDPERFGGMHFFNPVHKMPLVEVVRGARTSDRTVATLHRFAVQLGKVPVVCGDGPGFLVNRILGPYLNEAGWLLADGASIEEIDRAARRFGMPMGPLRLIDEIGIDVARHAGETLHEAFGARLEPAPPLVRLGESDRLGRKNGRGFYTYEDGEAKGVDESVWPDLGGSVPPERTPVDESEIRARLVLSMINEAARVLEDGVTDRAGDIDLAMVMGTGFPPFRGGLLRFADSLHPRQVVERLEEHRERLGERFEPAELLRRLAEQDRTFYGAHGS